VIGDCPLFIKGVLMGQDAMWVVRSAKTIAVEACCRAASRARGKRMWGYLGCLNHGNTGDEAVFSGIRSLDAARVWSKILWGRRVFSITDSLGLDGPRYLEGVVLGGGTLIGQWSFLSIVQRLQEHGHRLVAMGTGAGACGWGAAPQIDMECWRSALCRFTHIGVRGPLSQRVLAELGIPRVEIVGDLALALATNQFVETYDPRLLAVNVSVPQRSNESVQGGRLIEAIVRIAKLRIKQGFRIRPIVTDTDDLPITRHLCSELGLPRSACQCTCDPLRMIGIIGGCAGLIGVRLHSAVLAACAGVPPFLFGYRDKCADFMMSVGLERNHVDISQGLADSEERALACTEPTALSQSARFDLLSQSLRWRQVQSDFLQKAIGANDALLGGS